MPLDPTHRIFRPHRRARVPGLRLGVAALLFALPPLQQPASGGRAELTAEVPRVSTVGWANPVLLAGPGH
jgi:hypothetical protein